MEVALIEAARPPGQSRAVPASAASWAAATRTDGSIAFLYLVTILVLTNQVKVTAQRATPWREYR